MFKKLGYILLILSFLFYGLILIVPFLSITLTVKSVITTVLIIIGEICFWVGGIILGKELINKYRKWFNPLSWVKNKKEVKADRVD
jgi:4-amino-4-deoxy-L-arabinose transferase-like glycosyltransferase